jgi:hypothetical protein
MDRATKLIAIASTCALVALKVALLAPGWPPLLWMSAGFFVGGAVLASFDRRFVGVVLLFLYIFPALVGLLHGIYHINADVIWMSALLGVMAPDAFRSRWHVPARWRAPLALWALVCVAATIVVFGREMDFYPVLLSERGVVNSVTGGGGPAFVTQWVLHVGLVLLIGIVWFDWLFGARLDMHNDIATPLLVSCLMLAAVSMYQLFVDFAFLNINVFGGLGRASGTMFDANASGNIAGFWVGGAIIWAWGLPRWKIPLAAFTCTAAWLAVWASGSRGAFLLAVACTLFALFAFRDVILRLPRRVSGAQLAAAAVLLAVIGWTATYVNPQIVGPLTRVRDTLPAASASSIGNFAWRMWDRDGYGSAALAMIDQFPAFGIGVGGYHLMLDDFVRGPLLPPDNAQNWFRHQLAEFGLVGSVGWIAWTIIFGGFVIRPKPDAPRASMVARGALIGFAIVSLVGVPAQSLPVAITFWTFAFWYVSLVGAPPAEPIPQRRWVAVAIVAVVFLAGTGYAATTSLRLASRAQRAGFTFKYGLYDPEPDREFGEVRWARHRSAIVIDARSRQMEVSVSVNHHDIQDHPVDAKVWIDGSLALDTRLTDTSWRTFPVRVPDGERRVILETWVSRVLNPFEFGVMDGRQLGLLVRWRFPDVPAAESH